MAYEYDPGGRARRSGRHPLRARRRYADGAGDRRGAAGAPAVTAAGEAYTEALSQLEGVQDYEGLTQATAAVLEAHSALLDEGWPPQLAAEGLKAETANASRLLRRSDW